MTGKTIAEKVRDKEQITSEEFQKLLDKTDWKNYEERVVWHLNEPRCRCDSCYEGWFEWGREVYKNNPQQFEEEKQLALKNLRNKKESRRLDEEQRGRRTPVYLCSAV